MGTHQNDSIALRRKREEKPIVLLLFQNTDEAETRQLKICFFQSILSPLKASVYVATSLESSSKLSPRSLTNVHGKSEASR